jgi:hypothetical protein
MSTRKLILWSLVCGVLIVVAGGIKLRQSVGSTNLDDKVLSAGESTVVGGMTVSVESFVVNPDNTLVTVSIGGIAGEDAVAGWKMLAGGEASEPIAATGDATWCATTTLEVAQCVLAFPVSEGAPAVFYYRDGDNSQWALEE